MSGSRSTRSCAVREQAEHAQRGHHHRREDGVVDRDAGDPHGRSLSASGAGTGVDGAKAADAGLARRRRVADAAAGRCAARPAPARLPSGCRSARRATCASAARPLSTSTRPPATSVAAGDDDAPHQRAVLDRPDVVLPRRLADGARAAPSGAAPRRPARTRACAYWPARKRSSWLSSTTTTPMRARAGFGRRRDAVDAAALRAASARLTLDPHRHRLADGEPRHLVRADRAGQLERATGRRSSPRSARRRASRPARRGACRRCPRSAPRSAASRTPMREVASCACADLSCARAASRRASRASAAPSAR